MSQSSVRKGVPALAVHARMTSAMRSAVLVVVKGGPGHRARERSRKRHGLASSQHLHHVVKIIGPTRRNIFLMRAIIAVSIAIAIAISVAVFPEF